MGRNQRGAPHSAGREAAASGLSRDVAPSSDHDAVNRSVRRLHALIAGRVLSAARSRLPREQVRVWGEVVDVREGDECWFIELMDARVDGLVVTAAIPHHLDPPTVGHTVGVYGHLRLRQDGATVVAMVLGTSLVTAGVSSRSRARRALLEELRRSTPPPTDLAAYAGGTIVLVTSRVSRSLGDFQRNLGVTPSALPLVLEDVRLTDADDVARGVVAAAANPSAGMVVLMRGGGDAGDLAVFSSPEVTRAVAAAAASIPVVTGIGHAADLTLADEVASRSASTPSQAARTVEWAWRHHAERGSSQQGAKASWFRHLRITRRGAIALLLLAAVLAYFLLGRPTPREPSGKAAGGSRAATSGQASPGAQREHAGEALRRP